MGVAIQAMRMAMADEERSREMSALEARGEAQLRSAAVREMRAVMMRLAKGEVAMRVEVWRTNLKWWVMEEGEALRARLEAEMKSGQQHAAMRPM